MIAIQRGGGGGSGGGTPGGSDTQVQFNDAGSFGGSAAFVFDKVTGKVTIRQAGGTPGTDEGQISHDGTRLTIESKDGNVKLVPASNGFVLIQAGNNSDETYSLRLEAEGGAGARVTSQNSNLNLRTQPSSQVCVQNTNGYVGLRFRAFDGGDGGYAELAKTTDTAAATAASGRLIVRDNGSGKMQLCAVFPSGAAQVLATEP